MGEYLYRIQRRQENVPIHGDVRDFFFCKCVSNLSFCEGRGPRLRSFRCQGIL
jgi:hypothetical protein